MEETKRDFKVINTMNISSKGKAPPVVVDLTVIGLSNAGINGEANIRKSEKNPKGSGKKLKLRDASYYPLHKIIKIENNVSIVLEPKSDLNISNFSDFIEATESEKAGDIVDILPRLLDLHYKLISNIKSRIMIGDTVIVNFKYRSTVLNSSIKQKQPTKVKDVKFKNLNDMTIVIAYLENNDFYPINELELYDTN